MNHLLSQVLFSQNNSQWKEDIKLFLKYEAAVLTLLEPSDVVWESGIDMVGLICHRERKDDAGLVVCIKWYPPAKYWQRVGRLGAPLWSLTAANQWPAYSYAKFTEMFAVNGNEMSGVSRLDWMIGGWKGSLVTGILFPCLPLLPIEQVIVQTEWIIQ